MNEMPVALCLKASEGTGEVRKVVVCSQVVVLSPAPLPQS